MLIRPDPRIDTTNISTARLVEKKIAKPKALNYSQLLLRVKFLQASRVMRARLLSAIRHNYSEYITLAPGKTSEARHASTIKCNMWPA